MHGPTSTAPVRPIAGAIRLDDRHGAERVADVRSARDYRDTSAPTVPSEDQRAAAVAGLDRRAQPDDLAADLRSVVDVVPVRLVRAATAAAARRATAA